MPLPSSEEQWALVTELQAELKSRGIELPPGMVTCGRPEAVLVRFLKARKMDVGKSADMIAASVEWRQQIRADESLHTFLDEDTEASLRQCIPAGYVGFTKEGNPLRLEYTTKINVVDMLNRGVSVEDYIFYHMREMEYLMHVQFPEAAAMYGKEVIDAQSVILDLSGVSIRMLNSTFFNVFSQISKMYQDNYPETMACMFLVNIPSFFHGIWRLISSTIDDRIRQKIFFLRSRDLDVLKDFVAEEYIPISLGGSNPGEDGRYVNESDGYIQPVHRAMQREISVRQIAAKTDDDDDDDDNDLDDGEQELSTESGDLSFKEKGLLLSNPMFGASAEGSFASDSGVIDADYTGLEDDSSSASHEISDPLHKHPASQSTKQRRVKNKRWTPQRWFRRQPLHRVTVDADAPEVSQGDPGRNRGLGSFLCIGRAPSVQLDETHHKERRGDFYMLGHKAHSCRNMGIGMPGNIPSLRGSQGSIANTAVGKTMGGSVHGNSLFGSGDGLSSPPRICPEDGSFERSRFHVDSGSPVLSDVGSSSTPRPAGEPPSNPSLLGRTPQMNDIPGPGRCCKEVLRPDKTRASSSDAIFSPAVILVALVAVLTSLIVLMSTGDQGYP